MGSSIGVSRVTGPAGLTCAVDEAFRYDDVVLVEEAITARELLCGVIGDADEAEASVPSELKVTGGFSDYAQKYLTGATVTSPADVTAPAAPSSPAQGHDDPAVRAANVSLDAAGRASFTLHTPAGRAAVRLRLPGGHQVANALAAACAASAVGPDRPVRAYDAD